MSMLNIVRRVRALKQQKMRTFRYYYYHEIKRVCENRHRTSYIVWHIFKCAGYLYFVFRLFHVVVKLFEPTWRPKNDVIAHLFLTLDALPPINSTSVESRQMDEKDVHPATVTGQKSTLSTNNDRFFMVTIAMLMLCSAALEIKIYFSPVDTIVFQMYYDFVVRLRKFYIRCRLPEPERKSVLEQTVNELHFRRTGRDLLPHFRNVARAYALIHREHRFYDKQQLANAPLEIYSDMSLRLRFKLMTIMDSVEFINFWQLIIVCKYCRDLIRFLLIVVLDFGLASFVAYNTIHLAVSLSLLDMFFPLMELFFLGVVLSFVILLLILMSNFAFTSAMIFIEYITEVNVKLGQSTRETRKLCHSEINNYRLMRSSQKILAKVFKNFMKTHVTISHQIQFANREEWSMVLVISILNHLPINAYLLYRFLTGTATVLSLLLLVSQWTFLLIVLAFLAYYTSVLHKSHRTLFAIQMYLSKHNILVKYKSLRMYELLNNKRKIGITIGPSPTISYTFVLEILIVYIGIILYMFKTMKKFG